jgi:hypothetical protein
MGLVNRGAAPTTFDSHCLVEGPMNSADAPAVPTSVVVPVVERWVMLAHVTIERDGHTQTVGLEVTIPDIEDGFPTMHLRDTRTGREVISYGRIPTAITAFVRRSQAERAIAAN